LRSNIREVRPLNRGQRILWGMQQENTAGCSNSSEEQRAEVRMQGVNSAYMMP